MFTFGRFVEPVRPPATDDVALWTMQGALMDYAEQLFGARNPGKKLYQPSFDPNGPHIRHTPNFDGGFAELSPGSQLSWSCAFYELAHETVHLLDLRKPVQGSYGATYLEEALAVSFSVHCCQLAGVRGAETTGHYLLGIQHAERTGRDLFSLCRDLRVRCGHFSAASAEDIAKAAPDCPMESATFLASPFVGRPT